jgi:deazaflavin-dependent oxidoreductase (nitroreductase family)
VATTNSVTPRYVRPGFFMARVVNPIVKRIGAPALTVRGRRSGRSITVPLAPFDYQGVTYLVGGRGETQWVRNLRAAGQGMLRYRGAPKAFRAVELQGADRDRIVVAYRDLLGRRVSELFKALPDLADHPVFRVEPED